MINMENNETRRWQPLPTLLLGGAVILTGMTVNHMVLKIWPVDNRGQAFVMGGSFLLTMLLVIPIAGALTGWRSLPSRFALRLPPWRLGVIGAAAFVAYVGGLEVVFRLIDRQAGMETMSKIWHECPPGSVWKVGFLVNVLVLAPVCEEVMFRGFLLEGLRLPVADRDNGRWLGLHWSDWLAVVVSATFWTGLHGQYEIPELVALLMMGIVLGAVRLRTKSLYVVIGLHLLNNSISMLHIVNA